MTETTHLNEHEQRDSKKPGPVARVFAFPLTQLVIEFVAIAVAATAVAMAWNGVGFARNTPEKAIGAVLLAAAVIALYKGLKIWFEHTPDTELSFAGAGSELVKGLALGGALFSLATAAVALFGGFEVLGVRGTGQLWTYLAIGVVSGVMEETLFRGILFRHLEAMLGSWAALALTSALFGAGHIFNPGATWFAAFAIAVEAGILLGAAFMLTRRLWLAIGIHAAWNFTQGWVFSIPVSGGDEPPLGLLITRRVGPDWLTGGQFGLEASVVTLVVATLGGLALLWLAVRKGEVRPPLWRRSAGFSA